jgi:hypothetical protein
MPSPLSPQEAQCLSRASPEYRIGGPICLSERYVENRGKASLASEAGRLTLRRSDGRVSLTATDAAK